MLSPEQCGSIVSNMLDGGSPRTCALAMSAFFAAYAEQLPDDGEVGNVSKILGTGPSTESHAAPLAKLPAEEQADERTILSDVDQAILDLLYRMDAPMTGPDIAEAIGNSLSYVKERLSKSAPLRAEGLIGNKARVGYWLVSRETEADDDQDYEAPRLCPAEIAIAQLLASQPDGERLTHEQVAARSGYKSVRRYLGPSGLLAKHWGLKNGHGGYYLKERDRERVRQAFP